MEFLKSLLLKLLPIDWLILTYNFSILIFISFSSNEIVTSGYLFSIHFLIKLWVLSLAWSKGGQQTKLNQWLRIWYPLIILIWFIPEMALLQKVQIFRNFDFELLLIETTLFPQRFYFTTPLSLSLFSLEIFHGIILSLFIFLFLPAWLARKKSDLIIREYIFVLIFVVISHLWIGLILPVKGPSSLRLEVMPEGQFFIPLMNFISESYFQTGATIPSLLIATGVVITAYVSKFFPRLHRFMILWLFLLLISTVICTFHYSVSAMAGMLTGLLFLRGGKKLYEKIL